MRGGKRPGWWRGISGLGALLLGMVACSDSSGPLTVSVEPQRNVMVIDEGFDVTAADLGGKVLAAFTVACPDEADSMAVPDGGAFPAFDELKSGYIATLRAPSESCHLVAGISPKPDPLASVRKYRDRWNSMVRGQRYGNTVFTQDEWNQITAAQDAEFKTFAYHGTATAGTVAHDNPGLRMVLVERTLSAPGAVASTFTCLVQSEIDEWVAVLSDPEVRQVYASRPVSTYTDEFEAIVADNNVGVINESFGRPPRAVLEILQLSQGCPALISLGAYFTAWSDLGSAWAAAHETAPLPYVWTQSAGNEATQIDSVSDSYQCSPGSDRHLLVGSTNLTNGFSAFSNFGACVDLYAPGEHIIAPYAGGWLLPVQGTSFAAPLVAWKISRTAVSPFDAGVARQRALDAADGSLELPLASFPRDFFYVPAQLSSALTTVTASTRMMPSLGRNLDRIDLSTRALGPLGRLLRR